MDSERSEQQPAEESKEKSDVPDSKSNHPDTKSNLPDTKTDDSEAKVHLPDPKTDNSEAKNNFPNTKTDNSDAKSDLSDTKTSHSDAKSNLSEPKTSRPDAESNLPDTKTSHPDAKSNLPDPKTSSPEAKSNLPDKKNSSPVAKSNHPEAKSNLPDTKSNRPDAKSNLSDTKSSRPDAKSNVPDTKASRPDVKSNHPDTKSNHPVVPNFDASFVRRSPRAPAKVKVNFNDVFNGESVKKKRSGSAGSTSSSSNGSESSPVPPVISGPRKTDDGREIDTYCWLCHKSGEDSVCARCPRVFHFQCLGPAHRFNEEGLCPECKLTSADGTDLKPSLTASKLADLLPFALNRMITNAPVLKTFKYSEKESKDLIRPMDLPTLFQNISEHHYKTTISFLSDVKWILHNLMILHGVSHSLSTSAKKLVSVCKSEMLDIEACQDCYEHAYSYDENWFCKLCSSNHTLVWAKLKGFPFWPAKVVKVIDNVADVRFFGSHEKGKVPVNHCYWLSKENPNDKVPKNVQFKKALEELELYTKNVHKKFGPVIYYPLATVYDPGPENISTKQVTRKREHVASGLSVKSKKLKTVPNVSIKSKTPVVELNKLSEATVRISTTISSARATISSLSSSKSKQTEQAELPVSKKQSVNSSEKTKSDTNSNSTATGESCATDKSLHKKNFMKHLELNTISPHGTSETASKNCNGLASTGSPSTVISSGKEGVSSSCSSKNVGGKLVGVCVEHRTGAKSPNKLTNSQGVKSVAGSLKLTKLQGAESVVDSVKLTNSQGAKSVVDSVNSNPAGEGKSSSPHKGSSSKDTEPLAQNSGIHNDDVTMSEQTSANSEDVVMSVDGEEVCDTSLSGEKEVPSVPNTNNEESVSGSRDEVSDTVTDVLNSLQFFVESSAAEPANDEQEPMYTEEQSHTELPCDQDNDVQVISPCPCSSSDYTQYNEVHSNPATQSPECEPTGENMGPIFVQQPPFSGNSQEQPVCFVPLPATLDLGKYQSKIYSVMRATVEEMWHDYVNTPHIQQIISSLQKEIEDLKAKYEEDMKDVSENTALILESVKSNMRKEKEEAIEALKKQCEEEKEKAIKETKKKTWCAYCGKEAQYYCCWNTSYCDFPCQDAHWAEHMATCLQENPYYDQQQQQQSPNISSDADRQRNQSGKGDGNRSEKFSKETYSKQQRARGNHSAAMSNKGQMPPASYQSPPHPPPFVSTPQPPIMTPNYASNVIPNSVQVMAPPHITTVRPAASPFVNRLPPPPPPAPNHQPLPFVSGQHPHPNQNAPHYQTANSQGNRMLTPVLPPHTSYQPRQYFTSPSTSKMYMAGPREVRYPAKPFM